VSFIAHERTQSATTAAYQFFSFESEILRRSTNLFLVDHLFKNVADVGILAAFLFHAVVIVVILRAMRHHE